MAKNKMYRSIHIRERKAKRKKMRKRKNTPFFGAMSPDKLMSILAYEKKHSKGGV